MKPKNSQEFPRNFCPFLSFSGISLCLWHLSLLLASLFAADISLCLCISLSLPFSGPLASFPVEFFCHGERRKNPSCPFLSPATVPKTTPLNDKINRPYFGPSLVFVWWVSLDFLKTKKNLFWSNLSWFLLLLKNPLQRSVRPRLDVVSEREFISYVIPWYMSTYWVSTIISAVSTL